ncbi:MAG: hypothetical protein IH933_03740 [Euryarchaeota archaeon]|nr:hypothetical protein [Euryarchaeota archaeon]
MDSAVDFWYPPSAFPLESVIEISDLTVTIQHSHDEDQGHPTALRIENGERSVFTERLRADPSISTVEVCGSSASTHLYLIEWSDNARTFFEPFVSYGGWIETVRGTGEGWHLRVLFPTGQAIKDTYERLVGRDQPPHLERIYDLANHDSSAPALPEP